MFETPFSYFSRLRGAPFCLSVIRSCAPWANIELTQVARTVRPAIVSKSLFVKSIGPSGSCMEVVGRHSTVRLCVG